MELLVNALKKYSEEFVTSIDWTDSEEEIDLSYFAAMSLNVDYFTRKNTGTLIGNKLFPSIYRKPNYTVERNEISGFFNNATNENWDGFWESKHRYTIGSSTLYKWLTLDDAPFTGRDNIGNVSIISINENEFGGYEHKRVLTNVSVYADVTYDSEKVECLVNYLRAFTNPNWGHMWSETKFETLKNLFKIIADDVNECKNSARLLKERLLIAILADKPECLLLDDIT